MTDKIKEWFFAFPDKEFTLTQLVKTLRISKTTANREVKRLEKEGFLRIQILGNLWRITCNLRHPYNTEIKIPYNLEQVYKSKIVEKIREKFPSSRAIILFGSYRKGDDVSTSDLDIAVEILNSKTNIIELEKIDLGFRKKVIVNLTIFSRKDINLNLFTNIANGIVLDGLLEVKP
ncbi:MAG: nucleotidyltransferase domain-containing protein [Nanobdellota archaeon]